MVFQREIDELLNEKQKEMEIGKIKKAIIAGDLDEADVLFKYSLLTPEEYQSIKIEFHQK